MSRGDDGDASSSAGAGAYEMDIDRATGPEWSSGATATTPPAPAARTTTSGAAAEVDAGAGVSAEWSGARGALAAEVELRLHASPARPTAAPFAPSAPSATPPPFNLTRNDTDRGGGGGGGGSGVVVRAEEALIVCFVLLLWIAAVALFINRWGKIRMLEPYQPKFQQQHRASCPAEPSPAPPQLPAPGSLSAHHRLSVSRGCGSCGDYTLMLSGGGGAGAGGGCRQTCLYLAHRPRQNSVFAGSAGAMALIPESPARRSRSAADLRVLLPLATAAPRRHAAAAAGAYQRYFAVTEV